MFVMATKATKYRLDTALRETSATNMEHSLTL
jgi:hypothetical protein